ncbi:type II toxin-antitoxin system RelE/ParE family toxin [Pseudomonas caspiana]|uniref:type II toxin-antitoxin system RelE/ParE family toxin n=1 Tax=Pseudomonas caspiana TaxID=1451454 RepID=UPI0032EAB629
MRTIALTEKARSDLLSIHEYYVANAGPKVAAGIILHLLEKLDPLTIFSSMGRPALRPGVRELVFVRYPFLALYRINDQEIQVIRIRHQRNA